MVSRRPSQFSVDAAGIAGLGSEVGEPGQLADAGECIYVAACGGEELRTEFGSESGHAHDDLGGLVVAKSGLGVVEVGELRVGRHPFRQTGDYLRGHGVAGQRDALLVRGGNNFQGQGRGSANVRFAPSRLHPCCSGSSDLTWGLIPGQQDRRAFVGQSQRTFQGGEHFEQLCPQPVDLSGPVENHIEATSGQYPHVDGDLISGAHEADIASNACLISDDERVASVVPAPVEVNRPQHLFPTNEGEGCVAISPARAVSSLVRRSDSSRSPAELMTRNGDVLTDIASCPDSLGYQPYPLDRNAPVAQSPGSLDRRTRVRWAACPARGRPRADGPKRGD